MELQILIDKAELKLRGVHPFVAAKALELVKKAHSKGIYIIVTQGLRTIAEQNALYAQGRSKPGIIVTNAKGGTSYHNYGLAFDFAITNSTGTTVYWNTNVDTNNDKLKDWYQVGQMGQELGLEWGGAWNGFLDIPHFQYTFGLSISQLQSGKKAPDVKPAPPKQDKLMWGDVEYRKGQIGRVTILKPINLWRDGENGKLEVVKILQPPSQYRVYGYRNDYGGQYDLGGGCWLTKMDGYIKYETPSRRLLEEAKQFYENS
ncbi:M15 family metallopeptidase [Bacillus infantis]|uniref:M15 family metallopeptidase n=1 Tax=Bacillus infantis TaxID=324767 RepID=UPI0020A03230|nr:M15 family metallopeptidase [Bacillus infantis]MCP1159470.1 M15 family metallopeptidase [Bacillus infantis]